MTLPMKKTAHALTALLLAGLISCSPEKASAPSIFEDTLSGSPSIAGNFDYLGSPYVTPGDRAYMVGHQDGSFPDLGWHIKGEMGGIWAHPIKLMDGFEAFLYKDGNPVPLVNAASFTNYPVANRHDYTLDSLELEVSRWQFVPDGKQGVVVEYSFTNTSNEERSFILELRGRPDLRPTWLGERTDMIDSEDISSYDADLKAWVTRDSLNPWHVVFGPSRGIELPPGDVQYALIGAPNKDAPSAKPSPANEPRLTHALALPPGGTNHVRFAIAGSMGSEAEAKATYSDLLENAGQLLEEKNRRYAALADRSKLTIPDSALQQAFEWLKYNSDWMIQEVPGIGRGITAGIPDYPWWFGVDSEYALRGYMAIGQTEIVYETIRLLDSVSMAVNGNGRILHEMSTNGAVFNPGNINETPQFASLIWHVYRWGGDRAFLERYFPTVKLGLQWLMETNDANENGFPDGFGMMEIHGLDSEMIDVAAYTQAAFHHASLMAKVLGKQELAEEYAAKAEALKKKINEEFWSEDFGSFADFMGTDAQALHLIEDAIVRADTLNKPWAIAELEETRASIRANPKAGLRPFVLHHNWVVNTPLDVGIADTAKALRALETARNFINPFGMFVTGIDRDDSAGKDDGAFQGSKVFSYTGAVMTLPTGVQAVSENNYGRPDRALDYLQRMTRSFSFALPGSMYEVSPDYGMMAQAWNIFSFAVPVVEQFFGIRPMAAEKRVEVRPMMPSSWNEAALENVKIGANEISVVFKRLPNGEVHLKITQTEPGWTLSVPLNASEMSTAKQIPDPSDGEKVEGNGFSTTDSVLELRYMPAGR